MTSTQKCRFSKFQTRQEYPADPSLSVTMPNPTPGCAVQGGGTQAAPMKKRKDPKAQLWGLITHNKGYERAKYHNH